MTDRLVSIDVEPGGPDFPVGFIGLAHLVDGELTDVELYRFMRPDIRYTWQDWCAAERVEAWKRWMRLDEAQRRELDVPLHGGFSAEEMSELLGTGDRFLPEHHKPEPPSFRTVWAAVEPQLRHRYVAAYGARFDRAQLRKLLDLAGVEQPSLRWIDGMEAIRHLTARGWGEDGSDTDLDLSISAFTSGGNTLDAQVVRHGLVDTVTASRRWSLHIGLHVGNKALSFDAAEDARLNALIFQRLVERFGSVDEAVTQLGMHVKQQDGRTADRGSER